MTTNTTAPDTKPHIDIELSANWLNAQRCGNVWIAGGKDEPRKLVATIFLGHDAVFDRPRYVAINLKGIEMLPPARSLQALQRQLREQLPSLIIGMEIAHSPVFKHEREAKALRDLERGIVRSGKDHDQGIER